MNWGNLGRQTMNAMQTNFRHLIFRYATVTYALGARFLLVVEANNQSDINFVKSVAERLDLKKLAKM